MSEEVNMKCTEDPEKDCDNEDREKCKKCVAPMWCFCTRPDIAEARGKWWSTSKH